jgi:hypothetical protein
LKLGNQRIDIDTSLSELFQNFLAIPAVGRQQFGAAVC